VVIKIGAETSSAVRGIRDVERALGSQMSTAEKVGAGVRRAMLPAVAVMGALGVATYDSVKKASDLAESQSKVAVIFGKSSKEIEAWSKTAPAALGQTQQAALDAASTMATFGKAAGLTGSDLTKFSTGLTGLSSDLASFYNTSPADAAEAIGAALRGESEPLRKYGVMLNDATLKAEAMKLGIYDGSGALTAQQKVLAAQAAIMRQTKDAQGDFARTADGAANKQRILAATMTQMQTELGTALLPAFQAIVAVMAKFAEWASRHQGLVKVLVISIGALAAAIIVANVAMSAAAAITGIVTAATAAWTAAQWLLNIALTANPIGLVVIAIAALVAGIVLAYRNSETFRQVVGKVGEALKAVATGAVDFFRDHIDQLRAGFDKAMTILRLIWPVLLGPVGIAIAIARVADHFGLLDPILSRVREGFAKVRNVAGDVGDAVRGIVSAIGGALESLATFAKRLDGFVDGGATVVLGKIRDVLRDIESYLGRVESAIGRVIGALGRIRVPSINLPGFSSRSLVAAGATGYDSRSLAGGSASAGGLTINISGAIDPEGTARQIRRILLDHERRQGRA
jgi:phage-related minor tail protein